MKDVVYIAGKMLPYFPKKVKNVTVTIGQNAELKCEVDKLNNYKVNHYYYCSVLCTIEKRNFLNLLSQNLSYDP